MLFGWDFFPPTGRENLFIPPAVCIANTCVRAQYWYVTQCSHSHWAWRERGTWSAIWAKEGRYDVPLLNAQRVGFSCHDSLAEMNFGRKPRGELHLQRAAHMRIKLANTTPPKCKAWQFFFRIWRVQNQPRLLMMTTKMKRNFPSSCTHPRRKAPVIASEAERSFASTNFSSPPGLFHSLSLC